MSDAEDLLAWQIKAAKLPEPVRQYHYARPRKLRADFAWPYVRLLFEVQGGLFTRRRGAHGSVTGILADIDRLNEATLAGWRLLRASTLMVKDGRALALIERALK
jgi:very-short-patch-repair endonuclease